MFIPFILIIFVLVLFFFLSVIGFIVRGIATVIDLIINTFCRLFSIKRKRKKKFSNPFFSYYASFNGKEYCSDNKYCNYNGSQTKRQFTYQSYNGYNDKVQPKKIFEKNEGEYISFEEI